MVKNGGLGQNSTRKLKKIDTFFDKELYIDWHNKVVKDSFKTSKTETECYIVEQLKKYPLANKTPMEVFMWVANLQKTLSN